MLDIIEQVLGIVHTILQIIKALSENQRKK